MIILITSCKNNEKYREALRQTWLKDISLPYFFLIGEAENTHTEDDVLHLEVGDDYNYIPDKQLAAFKYCLENLQFENIFICDDDTYVCIDRLLDSDYKHHDYYGGGPVRMWDQPYYALGGPGISLSKKAIKEIVANGKKYLRVPVAHNVSVCNVCHEEQYWGDRFIGITLNKAGIEPFYDERFVDITIDPLAGTPKQYNDIISYHGKSTTPKIIVNPKDIEDIHSHFQKPLRLIRVAMIVDQWSKGGAEKEFADMILDADPNKVKYVGVAMNIAWEFYLRNDLKGKMPPFHTHENRGYNTAIDKDYLNLHETFEEAIQEATKEADVIIKWHTYNLFLENINKPSILLSNATAWYTETKYKKIHADKYVGNSRRSTEWLPKQATDKLVIYSGHSEDRIKPIKGRNHFRDNHGFNESDKVISHIGRINLDKNLKPLCQAVGSLSEEWKLLLVGRVPIFHKEELEEILEEYLPNRYKLVSWIDNVGDAFAASDVFVLSSFYEGFSNALAEAWMSKTPTVFSRCGSADELIEKYGNIGIDVATDASAELLAESIVKAPLNVEGTENAYNMIKTFTREKAARKWERCITSTCYNRKTLKVGLLIPNLSFGGLKTWLESLVKNTSRGDMEYIIIKPEGCYIESNIDTVLNLSPHADMHIEENKPEFAKSVKNLKLNNVYFYENHFDLISGSTKNLDAIVTWGIEDLASLVSNLNIPIIMCSHYADEWNKKTLKNTCHVGTNFVAVSKTANIFPNEIKNSVSIINNAPKNLVVDKAKSETKSSWGVKSGDILIGFIGRWEYQKNPLALARAIKELPKQYKAVFIGTDWRFDKLADLENWDCDYDDKGSLINPTYKDNLNELLPSERYVLVPPQENIANCYNALDLVIVPSRSEGFGLTILESWMMKKPLVCTDVGIYKELGNFRNLGTKIKPFDSGKTIATAIEKALDTNEADLQSAKDLAFKKFNNINFINNWVNLIQKSVDNFKCYHTSILKSDPYFKIFELMKKHRTPKRVARALNIAKFPLPEREKEWTYLLVEKYLN